MIQLTLTLKMTTAQVVETSVNVNNNSPIQHYVHSDDQTQSTFEMTPGFKPFTVLPYDSCALYLCFIEPWLSLTLLMYLRFLLLIYLLLGWFCFLPFFDGFPCFSGIGFFLFFSSHSPDKFPLQSVKRNVFNKSYYFNQRGVPSITSCTLGLDCLRSLE